MLGWAGKENHFTFPVSPTGKILKIRNDLRIQIESRVVVRLCEVSTGLS